ncbi:hypothetical protein LCGC14_2226570 [marine sediment metagenome]|uniref:Phage ABA sandwich domain-containing protein n=1 Tax=marine sediment metagenome TaxID=412755 RepID=A0A0F9D9G6_9ZZZZ
MNANEKQIAAKCAHWIGWIAHQHAYYDSNDEELECYIKDYNPAANTPQGREQAYGLITKLIEDKWEFNLHCIEGCWGVALSQKGMGGFYPGNGSTLNAALSEAVAKLPEGKK